MAQWLEEDLAPNHLNVSRLESDWSLYLRGEKSLSDFGAEYCYNNLLLDEADWEVPARTQANGYALSEALRSVLPEELARYKGLCVHRSRELDKTHSQDEWVAQALAAERLGCSTRSIRKLAESGELERSSSGKINYGSILSLLEERGLPTYSR